jgi:hypothetical protein
LQPTEVSRTRAQRPEDVVGAELETVLYAQMLALFAPHAVRVVRHLPLLLATLTSRQPALRRAAAATLRHFAERHGVSHSIIRIAAARLFQMSGTSLCRAGCKGGKSRLPGIGSSFRWRSAIRRWVYGTGYMHVWLAMCTAGAVAC